MKNIDKVTFAENEVQNFQAKIILWLQIYNATYTAFI